MASLANPFVSNPSIMARRNNLQSWYLFFLTAILFGIQSTASLALNADIVVPFAFSAFFAAISYPTFAPKMNIRNATPILLFLLLVAFINIISYDSAYSILYLIGPLQLLYSIFLSIAVYFIVRDIHLAVLQKWCLALTFGIAALSVAELNNYVSSAFANITELLTANANLGSAFDASAARDLALHGAVRSKVLATEPSHAALTLMALSFGFFWTKPRFQLVIVWVVLIVICIWTIRSPVLVVALMLGPPFSLLARVTKRQFAQLLGQMLLVVGFAFFISDYVLEIFGSRIDASVAGDGSFDMRFTIPLQFTTDFLPGHIWSGVGVVGNFDMLTYEILAAYHERGVRYVDYSNAGLSLSNNLAQHFVSFGLIFGIVSLIILTFVTRMRSGWVWVIICIQCLTIWMFLGGYVSARVWVLCALILAIARRAELEEVIVQRTLPAKRARLVPKY